MASIKVILNAHPCKSGEYSLVTQVIHRRQRSVLFSHYRIPPEDFDPVRERVRGKNSAAARATTREINTYIITQREALLQIIRKLESSGEPFTAIDITKAYRQRVDGSYVRTFVEQQCVELERIGKHNTAINYRSMLTIFERFAGGKSCRFDRIDEEFLCGFEDFLKTIPLQRNTITFHLRILRAVYNKARKRGLAPRRAENPFSAVSFRIERTRKLAIGLDTLRRVAEADFSATAALAEARDLFLFSFYARGMSFVDMAYLRQEDIRNGTIYYTRHKTHQAFAVQIVEPLQQIIDRYAHCAPWILPVMRGSVLSNGARQKRPDLTPDTPAELLHERYKRSRGDYWYYLRIISERLDTEKRLCFNMARHTWASMAHDRNIPLSVISSGLGHTSEHTTQIYLDEIGAHKVNAANELLSRLCTSTDLSSILDNLHPYLNK